MEVAEASRPRAEGKSVPRDERLRQLCGRIAHDLNNHMAVVSAYCQLMKKALQRGRPVDAADLAEISEAAARTSELAARLAGFRKRTEPPRAAFDAAAVARGLDARARIAADVPHASGDAEQLRVALGILVDNARAEGAAELRVESCVIGREAAPAMRPGRYVRCAVSDDGPGLSATIEPFELFESTKGRDGLGLATAAGIARENGWQIRHRREGGRTVFELLLPEAH